VVNGTVRVASDTVSVVGGAVASVGGGVTGSVRAVGSVFGSGKDAVVGATAGGVAAVTGVVVDIATHHVEEQEAPLVAQKEGRVLANGRVPRRLM